MTILAYTIKPILELVPEALDLVKAASVDEEYPTNSASSCLASYLQMEYMLKVSGEPVDPFAFEKVASAIEVYDLKDQAKTLAKDMVKRAHLNRVSALEKGSPKQAYLTKEAQFNNSLCGYIDVLVASTTAKELVKEAQELHITPHRDVQRYSGSMYLNKEACIASLRNRFQRTNQESFEKLASKIESLDTWKFDKEAVQSLCSFITDLDRECDLHLKGFNIYKEALFDEAGAKKAMNVTLCNKQVPYHKIERLGKEAIASYVGQDVADEFDSGPVHMKQVLETLPRDLQQVVLNLSRNV